MFCGGEPDSLYCRIGKRVDADMDIPNMDLVRLIDSAFYNDGIVSDDLKAKYPYLKHEIDYIEEVTVFESAKWILEIAEDAELPHETRVKLMDYYKRIKAFQLKYKRLHDYYEILMLLEDIELLEMIYKTVNSPKMRSSLFLCLKDE